MNALVPKILDGEVLTHADDVKVIVATHPMRHETQTLRLPAGMTIAEIVATARASVATKYEARDFVAYIDGQVIPADRWHRVRLKPSTTLALRPVAQEPITAIIGAIIGAVGAFGQAVAAMGFFGKLLLAGLSFGAKFLLNKLFAPKPQDPQKLEAPKVSYSIAGSRNQAAQWAPIPVILGRHRVAPPYAAAPYTETINGKQYLRMLFAVGYGPLEIRDIKIGETPIEDFEEATVQIKKAFVGDEVTTIYPRQASDLPLSILLKRADGYQQRTTETDINTIQVDLVWQNGLLVIMSDGSRKARTCTIKWRYRKVGVVPWTNGPDLDLTIASEETVRRTLTASVAIGQYEVGVWKETTEISNTNAATVFQDVYWTALRSKRTGEPVPFPDPVALIAVRIKATSQLNGTVDTLNCVATSLVTAYNGSVWETNQESRWPSDHFRHVLNDSPANKRPVPLNRIDLPALQSWRAYCIANGFRYDKLITSRVSVYDQLLEICAAGRAMPVFKDGKWSVVWDEQTSNIVQMFTPRNSWGFEVQQEYRDVPHALRIPFVNAKKGYMEDERIVYRPGYTAANATVFEQMEFPGVTDTDAIWKHARFHLAQMLLRPAVFTLYVDFEGLPLTRNDRVRVAHDTMLIGLGSGRVTAVDNVGAQSVTVDEVLTLDASRTYMFRFRMNNGTFLSRSVTPGTGGELKVIPLVGTSTLPSVGVLFTFGESEMDSAIYRVLSIEPQNEFVHRLQLVDDAPEIYDADTGSIPDYDAGITDPVDPFKVTPNDLIVNVTADLNSGLVNAKLKLSWTLTRIGTVRTIQIEYRASGDDDWTRRPAVTAETSFAEIPGVKPAIYSVRIRSIFNDGNFSQWVTVTNINALFLLNPPANVSSFRTAVSGAQILFSWQAINDVRPVQYEIRYRADLSGVSWASATPIATGLTGNSFVAPYRKGTYLIKAMVLGTLYSDEAASIVQTAEPLQEINVVEIVTAQPDFAGVYDGTYFDDTLNAVVLADDTQFFTGGQFFTGSAFFTGGLTRRPSGTFQLGQTLDLGEVTTAMVTATIVAGGFKYGTRYFTGGLFFTGSRFFGADPNLWRVTAEMRTTDDDPGGAPDWTDWEPLVIGQYTLRAAQFRVLLESLSPPITPFLSGAEFLVDMPDRILAADDVPSGAGVLISFDPPFRVLKALNITGQSLETGDYHKITGKSETGATVTFYDSANTPKSISFDWQAIGYGSVLN